MANIYRIIMNELKEYRKIIDFLDKKLLEILSHRFKIAEKNIDIEVRALHGC